MQWGHLPTRPPQKQGTCHGSSLEQIKTLQTQNTFPLVIIIFPRRKDPSSHCARRVTQLPHTTRVSPCPQMALEPCGEAFGHTDTLMSRPTAHVQLMSELHCALGSFGFTPDALSRRAVGGPPGTPTLPQPPCTKQPILAASSTAPQQ